MNASLGMHAFNSTTGMQPSHDKYYDNACSHSMVPSLHMLSSVTPLPDPFSIGGDVDLKEI